ncbi:helix-turn-helix domain-containing protein [Demequina sp. NBRC 110051]|uniref:helix-turn-helix domain-containing protein n=1 Tax=Demequina sp. NBRC 110051 TaxID=1570340 RepID=UPI0013562DC8|nr:XRE family transcriptional regulator [Demequina sp. NBRC 110051]
MSNAVTETPGNQGSPAAVATESLGARVRDLRRARGLTLVELAQRCGLSHPFLSQVERDLANPSIRSLGQIARALGTSQLELLAPPGEAGAAPVSVVAAEDAARGFYGAEEALLLVGRQDTRFLPLMIRGTVRDFGDPFTHDEHEFVHLVSGRIEIELDGESTILTPGGSVYYGAGVAHRWRAIDDEGFHILVVKERPTFAATGFSPSPPAPHHDGATP